MTDEIIVIVLNFRLPEWSKKVLISGGELEWISHLSFQLPTNTTELARLKIGFLLREIFDRFEAKTKALLSPDRSIWIYSAHDTTIANILNAFGLFQVIF